MGGWSETYVSRPPFVADQESMNRLPGGRQIDWSYVPDTYKSGALKVKLNGAASATDTSLTVDALPSVPNQPDYTLAVGDLLYFGQSGEYARVTAPALAGATTVAVESLPANLEDDDEAVIPRTGTGAKVIPAGTVMCFLSSKKMVPRAARPGSETAIGLLQTPAYEGNPSAALTGYGVFIGGSVWENLLPDVSGTTISGTYKTEMQTAGVGTGFAFFQYSDDTGS